MNSVRRGLAPVLAVAALALGGAALGGCEKKAAPAITADEMAMGSPNAKVTVIEYASVACPFCARFNNEIFPAFKKSYVDTGKVRYVFREMLVGGSSEMSMGAAGFLLARCAGPDKYFKVVDDTFREQEAIYKSGDMRGGLLKIAKANGLNEKQFNDCVTNEASLAAMNARNDKAGAAGVGSTPTFFINGKKTFEGVPQPQALEAAVKEAGA
jgi:protein-disulfide isomerase